MTRFVGALSILLAALPSWAGASDIDDVARQMSKKLAAIQSVRIKGQMTYTFESHDRYHTQDMMTELLYRRPGQLKVVTDHFRIVANGETVLLRLAHRRKYALVPQDTTIEGIISDERFHELESMTIDERALVSSDPYAVLAGYASRHKLERLADERRDGQMCWVIRQSLAGEEAAEWMPGIPYITAWIAQKTGLIVRMEAKTDSPVGTSLKDAAAAEEDDDDDGAGEPKNMQMMYRMTELDADASLTPADFAFVPETGDKKADSLDALYGGDRPSQQGLARFALSGRPAPDFALKLVDGGVFKMSEQKGKAVVIDFWATWCGPCIRAMPHMRELHEAFRKKDVVFIGVSHDQEGDEDKIKKALAKNKIDYPTGIDADERSIGKSYAVRGIPCVVLVDRNGVVQGRQVGFSGKGKETLRSAIEKLLAGETLPSAAPMPKAATAEEDDDEDFVVNDKTELDNKIFVPKWKGPASIRRRGLSHDYNKLSVRLSPRYFSALSDRSLIIIDPATGGTVRVIPLPDSALVRNEMNAVPAFQYLHTPAGGVAVAVQRLYELEKKGRNRSYHNRGTTVTAVNAKGKIIWTMSLKKDVYTSAIHSIPVSADRDVLLIEASSQLLLIDDSGRILLDQQIVYGDRIEFDDRNRDGTIEVYIMGAEAAAYELRLPK